MRILVTALMVTILAIPASAGRKRETKEEKIRRFIVLTGGEELGKQMLDQMLTQVDQAVPGAPTGFLEKFRELALKDDMLAIYVPIYMQHLEEEELDAAIEFFSSPAGRTFVAKQPAIMREAMTKGQEWGQDLARRAIEELERENATKGVH